MGYIRLMKADVHIMISTVMIVTLYIIYRLHTMLMDLGHNYRGIVLKVIYIDESVTLERYMLQRCSKLIANMPSIIKCRHSML